MRVKAIPLPVALCGPHESTPATAARRLHEITDAMRMLKPTLALTWLLAGAAAHSQAPCRPADALARALLDGTADGGALAVTGRYALDEAALLDEGRLRVTVEAALAGPALRRLRELAPATLCVSLVLDVEGEVPVAHHRRLALDALTDCAVRATRTRMVMGITDATVPFPGRPGP